MSEFNEMIPQFESENENFTDVIEDTTTGTGFGAKVVVFNDNYHTFDQVVKVLQKAIGCTEQVGFYHAHTIHTKGKSDVYKGEMLDCIRVSSIIQEINLKTQIVS